MAGAAAQVQEIGCETEIISLGEDLCRVLGDWQCWRLGGQRGVLKEGAATIKASALAKIAS